MKKYNNAKAQLENLVNEGIINNEDFGYMDQYFYDLATGEAVDCSWMDTHAREVIARIEKTL